MKEQETLVQRDGKESWHRGAQLRQRMQDLLQENSPSDASFENAASQLASMYGDEVYSELLFHLGRLNFDPAEAYTHFVGILELRQVLSARAEQPVDFRSALVQYFTQRDTILSIPIVIDLAASERMQPSQARDELTGLPNCGSFQTQLEHEVRLAERGGFTVSLARLELDNFQFYRTKHGGEAADQVLVQLARILEHNIGVIDSAVRCGAEEFGLLLPATTKEMAHQAAKRVAQAIGDASLPHADAQLQGRLTVSIGIVTFPADGSAATQLMERADAALYAARVKGRNQIHLYGDNRRSHTRIEVSIKGQIWAEPMTHRAPFHTKDLSEGGMLIEMEQELSMGALVELELNLPDGAPALLSIGRVARVIATNAGSFQIGVQFFHPHSELHHRLGSFIRMRTEKLY